MGKNTFEFPVYKLFCFVDILFFILHRGFLEITTSIRKLQASFLLELNVQGSLDMSNVLFIGPLLTDLFEV